MYIAHYSKLLQLYIKQQPLLGNGIEISLYKGSYCLYRIRYPGSEHQQLSGGTSSRTYQTVYILCIVYLQMKSYYSWLYKLSLMIDIVYESEDPLFIPSAVPLIITPIHSKEIAIRYNSIQNPDERAGSCPESIVMRPIQYPPFIGCVHRHVSLYLFFY